MNNETLAFHRGVDAAKQAIRDEIGSASSDDAHFYAASFITAIARRCGIDRGATPSVAITKDSELSADLPLCPVHQSLEDRGKLEVPIGGLGCLACTLNEREELLEVLAPCVEIVKSVVRNIYPDSVSILREVTEFYKTHAGKDRVVVSYPASSATPKHNRDCDCGTLPTAQPTKSAEGSNNSAVGAESSCPHHKFNPIHEGSDECECGFLKDAPGHSKSILLHAWDRRYNCPAEPTDADIREGDKP